jgi:hypothetical protein
VYPAERIEKKHRVAVLRALRTLVVRREIKIRGFWPHGEKGDFEWFDENAFGRPTNSFEISVKGRPKRPSRPPG